MNPRITRIRRLVQVACFGLLLYGAFIWTPHQIELFPRIEPGEPRTTLYAEDRILWVSGQQSVIELYPPMLACRFTARGGLFKGCFLHFLSENITWKTSLKILLPHILLFVAVVFLFGRAWCGWVCPLGAMTDFMNGVRKLFGGAALRVPRSLNRFFGNLAQFLLIISLGISALIVLPALGASGVNDALYLVYCQICPARLAFPLLGGVNPCWYDTTNGITIFMTIVGWLFLGFFFAGFLVPRLWCRVCAVGAFMSYFNRGALFTLEKRVPRCSFCGTCERVCPLDIERVYRERERRIVTDADCTLCLRCVEACPEKDCLEAKLVGLRVARS